MLLLPQRAPPSRVSPLMFPHIAPPTHLSVSPAGLRPLPPGDDRPHLADHAAGRLKHLLKHYHNKTLFLQALIKKKLEEQKENFRRRQGDSEPPTSSKLPLLTPILADHPAPVNCLTEHLRVFYVVTQLMPGMTSVTKLIQPMIQRSPKSS